MTTRDGTSYRSMEDLQLTDGDVEGRDKGVDNLTEGRDGSVQREGRSDGIKMIETMM